MKGDIYTVASGEVVVLEVGEAHGARLSGGKGAESREKSYKIIGTDDDLHAYMELSAYVYTYERVLRSRTGGRKRLVVQSIEVEEGDPGAGIWLGTVKYAPLDPEEEKKKQLGDRPQVSISTKGGTAKVTRSLKTVQALGAPVPVMQYRWGVPESDEDELFFAWNDEAWKDENDWKPSKQERETKAKGGFIEISRIKRLSDGSIVTKPGKPPNFHRGIGYEDGAFQGTQKIVPAWSCTVSVTKPDEFVSPHFRRMIEILTGTVNSTPFLDRAPGECLFLGASMDCHWREKEEEEGGVSEDDDEDVGELVWDIKFEFQGGFNVRNAYVGKMGPFTKKGFEYIWPLRQERESTSDDVYAEEETYTPGGTVVEGDPEETMPETVTPESEQPPALFSDEKMTVSAPVAVYVEQLYRYIDFSVFGI